MDQKRRQVRGYALALFAACGWATGGLLSKWAFTEGLVTPEVLAGARAGVGALLLGFWLVVIKRKRLFVGLSARSLLFLVPFGAFAVAGMQYTYFKTISLTNVATAILLEYLAPIFTLMAAVTIFRHRLRWQMVVGVAAAILGCAVAVGAFNPGGLTITPAGLMWGIVAAMFFALYSVMGDQGNNVYDSLELLFYSLFFASMTWLILVGPREISAPFTDIKLASMIMIMAIVSTILAFGAYLVAMRTISPTHASITAMLEPVVAGIAAAFLFGETMTFSLVLGGAIIVASVAFIQQIDMRKDS